MKKKRWFFWVLILLAVQLFAGEPTTIIYVRHAETWGNIRGKLIRAGREDELPSGTGLSDILSPHGEEQLKDWFKKLDGVHVDAVCVSPAQRTQRTALAFLEARDMTAEIWPELIECGGSRGFSEKPDTSIVDSDAFWARINPLRIVDTQRISPRPNDEYAHGVVGYGISHPEASYLAEETIRLLIERYENSGETVLLVGHSMSGKRLLNYLLEVDSVMAAYRTKMDYLKNTSVSILRKEEGGAWELFRYSDEEVSEEQREQVRAARKSL